MPRRDLTFRVFVSSTFSDFKVERHALQTLVFPRLRRYCQERGARFQPIDLRWGVSREAAFDQRTMAICLEELERCQEVSPRPNFIVLLGNRYGWRPLPTGIEAVEFEALLATMDRPSRGFLTTGASVPPWRAEGAMGRRTGWYRLDANAFPEARYILQPRLIEYPDGASEKLRAQIRDEEAADWSQVESEIRACFFEAISRSGWGPDDVRRSKYETSATHQEISAGVLSADSPEHHVFCYIRDIQGLPASADAFMYRDLANGIPDDDAARRLNMLKQELTGADGQPGLLPAGHVHTYAAEWRDAQPAYDLQPFCDDVFRDLTAVIDAEIAEFRQRPDRDRERDIHREFGEERRQHFVGRSDVLERIRDHIDSDDSRPLLVHGPAGSGKTTLMAQAAADAHTSFPDALVVQRFIGATPASSDLRALLIGVYEQLGMGEAPREMDELVRAFHAALCGGTSARKMILYLDSLDQLNPTDNALSLYWIPQELASTVKLVISIADPEGPEKSKRRGDNCWEQAVRRWPDSLVAVGPLDADSGSALLNAWLRSAGRTVQPEQRAAVLEAFRQCPFPLYLKLAAQEAENWHSWDGSPTRWAETTEGLLARMLERLETPANHGRALVSVALGYLAASKHGLTEDELLDMLSRPQSGVLSDFAVRSPDSPAVDRLPIIVWSRLVADLKPYLVRRRTDGTVVMGFYHRQVRDAVVRRYLPTNAQRSVAHEHLATYFHELDYWAESFKAQRARSRRQPPTPRPVNVRKVVELPFHRLEAAKYGAPNDPESPLWDAVAELLMDYQFLEAKAEATLDWPEHTSPASEDPTQEARE